MCQRVAADKQSMNVYVFCTSIQTELEKSFLDQLFVNKEGMHDWSVDLSDWQHVLRVETVLSKKEIKSMLRSAGIQCAELTS
jgi:hypothetical protein